MTAKKQGSSAKSRNVSSKELALWQEVTRDVKPLQRNSFHELKKAIEGARRAEIPVSAPASSKKIRRQAQTPSPAPARPAPSIIEPRTKRRLRRGRQDVDARLDLHGMTQEAAHGALKEFVFACSSRGFALVLIITGKGSGFKYATRDDKPNIGVLKRMVPFWLSGADLAGVVIGFEEASFRHGGSGALYVRLRRQGPARMVPDDGYAGNR